MEKLNTPLTTIPGVSTVVAGTILGETVEYHKENPDPRSLLAYAGLEPQVRKSGKWVGKMKMSKRGSLYLRQAIHMASFYAAYHESMFEKIYKRTSGKRKIENGCINLRSQKMAYVIASILRTNKAYQSEETIDRKG